MVYGYEYNKEYSKINLDSGCASRYITSTIVADSDRQTAREKSQRLKEEGKILKQRLSTIKAFMTSTKKNIEACKYHLNMSKNKYRRKMQ